MSGGLSPALCGADDERTAGRLDHIVGDHRQAVDLQDAPDLDEQAMEQAEVAARDPRDRGHGLGIGKVGLVEGKSELPPVAGEHEGEFVIGATKRWRKTATYLRRSHPWPRGTRSKA